MLVLAFLLLGSVAAAPQEPRSWIPQPKALPASLTDSDPQSYETFCQGGASDPVDVGLSWSKAQRLGEFTADYVTLAGRAYEPAATGQSLEYWNGRRWMSVRSAIDIDYRDQGAFAPVEGSGTATWRYRFEPIETERIRLVLNQPRNDDGWHRCFAIRSIQAGPPAQHFTGAEVRITGSLPHVPGWLAPGANLAALEAGAQVVAGNPAEVRWPRDVLVNRVDTDGHPLRVSWWDGQAWRDAEPLAAGGASLRFLPVATTRLRVSAAGPVQHVRAFLDEHARQYFQEIQQGRTDQLGSRFRRQPQPDLAGMESLLLSLDFAKVAIGRPADLHESMVGWNGTVFMEEAEQPGAKSMDRWFAFAAGSGQQLFGTDWMHTQARYLDDYLPATLTTYRHSAIRFDERTWVTAPGPEPYGTAIEVQVSNESDSPARAVLTLAMGHRAHAPSRATPLSFSPEITGYALDRDERTIRAANGEIVLYAQAPGAWEGTIRENHLRYELSLGPKQSRTIRFFAPSVDAPLRAAEPLRSFDWDASLREFRAYWRQKLDAGMKIGVPEPRLNAIYRNLLAQSLIITLDGDSVVRYGAYAYESYFGLEEGWPAVALAQFGYPAEAQKILSIMLSPALMNKSNYHHQYRNGLEGWYAATIYRLTRDRAWLAKIAPDLEAAAEWSIRTIHGNGDPRYGGILPRHAYGGDIHTPAYSLYSNATCWRGLNDTALVIGDAGRAADAERYRREADQYRRRLWQLADALSDRQSSPPFLPMSFEIGDGADFRKTEPPYAMLGLNVPNSETWRYLGNYWNLFAPSFLELRLFEPDDPRAGWVADYMDARGGTCGSRKLGSD